jgi:hypothetical protein
MRSRFLGRRLSPLGADLPPLSARMEGPPTRGCTFPTGNEEVSTLKIETLERPIVAESGFAKGL